MRGWGNDVVTCHVKGIREEKRKRSAKVKTENIKYDKQSTVGKSDGRIGSSNVT